MSSKRANRPSIRTASAKSPKVGKARLDVLLVERGFAASRARAQAMLLAGQVRVNGSMARKAGAQIPADARIERVGEPPPYASRAGVKLEGALEDFVVSPEGKVCLDIGSSTGGFTDCLLQHGARKVYAVDVTVGQLEWRLRQDPRVVTVERNARYLRADDIGELVEVAVVDVSFISLTKIVPAAAPLVAPTADFLILIKPQFELEKGAVGRGGIVRDSALHQKAIERVTGAAVEAGLEVVAVRASRITGAEGNQEFFLHARRRD